MRLLESDGFGVSGMWPTDERYAHDRVIIADAREFNPAWFKIQFGVIVADPPWAYRVSKVAGSAEAEYPTLSLADLQAMPIAEVAKPNSVLLLWGTWPQLPEALSLMKAWGFEYVTGLPWVKVSKGLAVQYGIGYWVRGCSEYVLIGRRGDVPPPRREGFLGLLSPNLKHSRKPGCIHELAESLPGPYLELFAREQRPGWVCFGNEVGGKPLPLEVS
jgi:N6-adenosine-specific RNA methylase IME4